MDFCIEDTFTESLGCLTGDKQKAVKTTAFDLQLNPANPGMSFHKLAKAKDKNLWSVQVNRDIRLIVHRTEANLLLCYVDQHVLITFKTILQNSHIQQGPWTTLNSVISRPLEKPISQPSPSNNSMSSA